MSADNWAHCPKCMAEVDKLNDRAKEKIKKSYGKIPEEDYLYLLKRKPLQYESTLREEYDIGIRESVFTVDYKAVCTKCNFVHSFSNEKIFDTKNE